MVTSNAPFKPSPLSFGSPRASPFRRPSTPNSPPSIRPGTPGSSPGRGYTPVVSPSKLHQSYTVEDEDSSSRSTEPIAQPKFREMPPSPTKGADSPSSRSPMMGNRSTPMMAAGSGDAVGNLNAAQLREIREAFQVLDRDNDGTITRDDVTDVLANLGQDTAAISQFFPGTGQTMNFPTFLNTLSSLMGSLSSSQELLNALSAFDDDDSGQVDVAELRDALLHTAPEEGEEPLTEREIDDVLAGFTGRRAFGKTTKGSGLSGKRGEVFRYQEFVASVVGGMENGNTNPKRETGAAKS
ncbi:hypothetical protein ASPZODRAFT_1804508 [Penicilliopsis zonata CBS 506.65]|uniref:EF-hand domain-containing protein n=1 Tax=Penicilliopsis zonata CBS 506.65 TaxID=1073090 RepID=A0A1L9SL06_9EURO|nr:hypothetical protein ASPZODRAFT_1804508 [Penicilliopsis zonata CBS 506.65]OJJ47899.1 hypothetical protein ASPZODRAFT_1804508 [Penicilliopsis zonata CBS 506.65]